MKQPDYNVLKNSLLRCNTSPVEQVNTSPVEQVTRNTLRNTLEETHSQTQRENERENEILLSENQKEFLRKHTRCDEEQLEKALHIVSISKPRPKNIMGYLLKSGFYNGECILEPTIEEEQESKEERAAKEERVRVESWANGIAAKMQDSIVAALSWFQSLPGDTRARVESNILSTRPTLRDQFLGKKPFGPLVLVLLREERRKLEVQR